MAETKSGRLPPSGAGKFAAEFPRVWETYAALGEASAKAGPLDVKTRRLIKLAMAIGAGSEGAVHSHVRQALDDGVGADEVRQVVVLAITTLGFPSAMAAYSWVNDLIEGGGSGGA